MVVRWLPVLGLMFFRVDPCAHHSDDTPGNQTLDDCNAMVDALAAAHIRCGEDETVTRQHQLDAVAQGNCSLITSIRDHGALQTQCLPALKTISCLELAENALPDTCQLQLEQPTPPPVVDASAD